MIPRWLARLFGATSAIQATERGVAIGRDNTGNIFTGNIGQLVVCESGPTSPAAERLNPEALRTDLVARTRDAALELIEAGRRTWRISDHIVPTGWVIAPDRRDEPESVTNQNEVLDHIAEGSSAVLFGEGGIGKTTAALELAKRLWDRNGERIPVYLDASTWASTSLSLLDYIATLPSFAGRDISAVNLARLANASRLSLFINGWNEIPAANKELCAQRMQQLIGTSSKVGVVLTSRTVADKAGLVSPLKLRITGLNWFHQKQFIRGILSDGQARKLIERLARNRSLRVAARNPLVLSGVVKLQQHGIEDAQGLFDIFKAIVEDYEVEGTRRASLQSGPLSGMHASYLAALACAMNREKATTLSAVQARSALSACVQRLIDEGQIAREPCPSEMLQALCDHHLLYADGNLVRFAHQRFQEYFAAAQLIELLTATNSPATPDDKLLVEAINWPFWEDTLLLVAEKLAQDPPAARQRVLLVEAAFRIDLGITSRLIGTMGFGRADDHALFDGFVKTVQQLANSSDDDIVGYASTCMIDSKLCVFADHLWSALESDSRDARLSVHRLGHESISEKQLGGDARRRIAVWPAKRRAEFIREMADNADNAELLQDVALHDESDEVRVAATKAIAWDFPASEFAVTAWLQAADDVKVNDQLLSVLQDALSEAGEPARRELVRLVTSVTDDKLKVRMALQFPEWLADYARESLLHELHDTKTRDLSDEFIDLVRRTAPDDFLAAVQELSLTRKFVPDCLHKAVVQLPAEKRAILFERAWSSTESASVEPVFSRSTIAACALREHTEMLVRESLRLDELLRTTADRSSCAGHKHDLVRDLLANVPGDDLLSVVLQRAPSADYRESDALIDLVVRRFGHEHGTDNDLTPWQLSIAQVDALIEAFWDKVDTADPPQHWVQTHLCSIGTRIDAQHYAHRVLDLCKATLNAWTRYYELMKIWREASGRGIRASNPSNGLYLEAALARCGFDVLPNLFELLQHPHSQQQVPGAIARIVSQPWIGPNPKHWLPPVDGVTARERREANLTMLQPQPQLQAITDQAARMVRECVFLDLQQTDAEPPVVVPAGRRAPPPRRPNSALLSSLARIPSPEGLPILWEALSRSDVDKYTLVTTLCVLVRSGLFITDPRVAERMQSAWREDAAAWLDQSAQYRFDQLNGLLYFVQPEGLLQAPLTDYLARWIKKCHVSAAIRTLKYLRVVSASRSLAFLARQGTLGSNHAEELGVAIVESTSADAVGIFLELLEDGTFFRLHRGGWHAERQIRSMSALINSNPAWRDRFLAACQSTDTEIARVFARVVLSEAPDGEERIAALGLQDLDSGDDRRGSGAAYETLLGLFSRSELLEQQGMSGAYEVYSRSCNVLREKLFERASSTQRSAKQARSILCHLEASRRERGRPVDEPRHPMIGSGRPWHVALLPPE